MRDGGDARRGLSLVEVLVAIKVLALAILGTLGTQNTCRDLTQSSRETDQAVADLSAAMEEVLLVPIETLADPAGPFPDGVAIPRFADLHLEDETMTPTYPNLGGGGVPDPLEIVITCQWTDHAGRPRTLALASLKTR
ncbi:MAG: hypothetical protein AB1726_11390 [Planctomycetota bacterium]